MKKAIAVLACFFVLVGCGEKKSKDAAQTNAVSSIRDTEIPKGNYQQNTKPKSPLDFVGHPHYNVCMAYAGVAKSASVQWFESGYSYDEIIATARSMKNFSPNNPKYAFNALSWEQTVQIINKAISDTPYSQDLRKITMDDIFFSCMAGKEDVPGRPDLKQQENITENRTNNPLAMVCYKQSIKLLTPNDQDSWVMQSQQIDDLNAEFVATRKGSTAIVKWYSGVGNQALHTCEVRKLSPNGEEVFSRESTLMRNSQDTEFF